LDNVTVSSTGTTYSFDVTSFVNSEVAAGHDIISFYLEALAADTDVIFDSREGANPPVLELQPTADSTFDPVADAFVRSGTPTQNYGTSTDLYEKNGGTNFVRYGYLKFDLTNYSGTGVSDAQLKLYAKTLGAASGVKVYSVTDDSWTESGLNWNNKPTPATELDYVTVSSTGTTYSFDVTSFVNSEVAAGHDVISFYLEALAADTDVIFDSREGANPPVLEVAE
jgi:hypothetical protein